MKLLRNGWVIVVSGFVLSCSTFPLRHRPSKVEDFPGLWRSAVDEAFFPTSVDDPLDSLFADLTWEQVYEKALRSPGPGLEGWTSLSFLDVPPAERQKIQKLVGYTLRWRGEYLRQVLERGRPYYGYIVNRLLAEGLPVELVYLPIIESAYNPRARSRAGAVGLWQFIPSTARRFGLRVDWWVDERLDPYRSTDAAIRYLQALYEEFGRWDLALAAYNVGEEKIRRALRRNGGGTFWDIYRQLPRETQMYVPLFITMYEIFRLHRDELGLDDPQVLGLKDGPPVFDYVELWKPTTLSRLARWAGLSEDEFLRLNPWMLRRALPPNPRGLRIRLPAGTKEVFLAALEEDRDPAKWQTFQQHRIRKGETLSQIAQLYGITVSMLMEMNDIQNPRRLQPGHVLLVPPPPVAKDTSTPRKQRPLPNLPERSYFLYEVRQGDTLYDLARTFGVSVRELMRINNISSPRGLRPGTKIRIPVQEGS